MNILRPGDRTIKLVFLLLLSGICLWIWIPLLHEQKSGLLTVAFLDVGQGDSIYIESPVGNRMLIDAGPGSAVLRDLGDVMPPFDRRIDAILETHPDSDHMAGFNLLLPRYTVGMVLEPGIRKDSATALLFEKEIDQQHVPRYVVRTGMWLDLGGGVQLRVLYPNHDVSHIDQNKDNDGGVVAQLQYGSTTMMFMADVTKTVEEQLLTMYPDVHADVLKIGHHGSRTATSEAFVSAVQPRYAVVSVGKNNKYHLPNPEPLQILRNAGALIERTDIQGSIVFQSDGASLVMR